MNHSKETLAALDRRSLIQTAISTKAATPSQAYSTKSVILIDLIMAKQSGGCVAVEVVEPETSAPTIIAVPTQTEITVAEVVEPKSAGLGLFKVRRKDFQRQLATVSRVPVGGSLAILKCVLISFGAGRLRVEASSLDAFVATTIAAETDGEGQVAVPFSVLSKFVAACTGEHLMAELVSKFSLRLFDTANKTEIRGLGCDDFPAAPALVGSTLMKIQGARLSKIIGDTIKCASTDANRYILNGIAFDTSNGVNVVVSTDGRRLCRVAIGATEVTPPAKDVRRVSILPLKIAEIVAAGIPADAEVTIMQGDSQALWRLSAEANGFAYQATVKLVDGNFPFYTQVIPRETGSSFEINSAALLSCIQRLEVVLSEKSNTIKMQFSQGKLRVDAASADVGAGTEPIDANGDKSVEMFVGLNPKYIREVVSSWKCETFTLSVRDETSPILLSSEDRLAVIMPCRLS